MMLSIPFGFRDALLIITAVSPTFAQYGPVSPASVITVGLSTSTVWSGHGYDGVSTPSSPGSVSSVDPLSTSYSSTIVTMVSVNMTTVAPTNLTSTASATGNASVPLSSVTDAPTSTEDGEQSTVTDSTTTPTSSQSGAGELASPFKHGVISAAIIIGILAAILN
ncbi:hypothetical protein QBC37DRAFT_156968 [Rhypophila decipiens]|uniref:Uncharacterized protein n=1 Tax=Rhypophila decipiens TaxID=261697 RepID=A0AAN6Y980_9PEZI|nr:hypothetical protein QBC37DRAFT_156968 [Rhypophila decipiens]